jgi:hypothetical protein
LPKNPHQLGDGFGRGRPNLTQSPNRGFPDPLVLLFVPGQLDELRHGVSSFGADPRQDFRSQLANARIGAGERSREFRGRGDADPTERDRRSLLDVPLAIAAPGSIPLDWRLRRQRRGLRPFVRRSGPRWPHAAG